MNRLRAYLASGDAQDVLNLSVMVGCSFALGFLVCALIGGLQ